MDGCYNVGSSSGPPEWDACQSLEQNRHSFHEFWTAVSDLWKNRFEGLERLKSQAEFHSLYLPLVKDRYPKLLCKALEISDKVSRSLATEWEHIKEVSESIATFSKNLSIGKKRIRIKALTEEEQGSFTDIQILLAKASTFQKHFVSRIKDSGRSIHVLETTTTNCGEAVSKCKRASFVVLQKSHPCNKQLSTDYEASNAFFPSPFAIVKKSDMEELSLEEIRAKLQTALINTDAYQAELLARNRGFIERILARDPGRINPQELQEALESREQQMTLPTTGHSHSAATGAIECGTQLGDLLKLDSSEENSILISGKLQGCLDILEELPEAEFEKMKTSSKASNTFADSDSSSEEGSLYTINLEGHSDLTIAEPPAFINSGPSLADRQYQALLTYYERSRPVIEQALWDLDSLVKFPAELAMRELECLRRENILTSDFISEKQAQLQLLVTTLEEINTLYAKLPPFLESLSITAKSLEEIPSSSADEETRQNNCFIMGAFIESAHAMLEKRIRVTQKALREFQRTLKSCQRDPAELLYPF